VTRLADLDGTDRDVQSTTWRSRRLVLAKEGVGFSFHETTMYAGTETEMWYANHVEAVYCVGGTGELENRETGEVHEISDGTMYLLVGDDGEVVAAHPYRVDVSGRRLSAADVRQLREQFARSAEAAMGRWRFDPAMVPAGSTVEFQLELTLDHVRAARTDEGAPTPVPWFADGRPARIVSGGTAPTENVIGSIL
jgi:hypothetical protein